MRVLDLFSGIGGFSLGFEWASPEFETVAFCEIDPYAQKVLKKHWPEVPIYDDVTKISAEDIEKVGPVECITGGFPCQDISVAGKQKGMGEGTRSGLFFEIIRIIKLCRPRWIVLENVSALLSRSEWMGAVLGALAEIGYDAEWEIIRASDMGAPHRRERIWIVAWDTNSRNGNEGQIKKMERRENSKFSRVCANVANPSIDLRGTPGNERPEPFDGSSPDVADTMFSGRRNATEKRQMETIPGNRFGDCGGQVADTVQSGLSRSGQKQNGKNGIKSRGKLISDGWWKVEPNVGRVAHGVPSRVDRLKCLGNAIVPQIAELIGKQIMEVEHENPRQTD